MVSHAALLLGLMLAAREVRESIGPVVADTSAPTQLVWIPVPGAGGGGGGGGNRTRQPAQRLMRSGNDRITTPAVRTGLVEFSAREPEPAIAAPTLPLAADSLTLPGAMDSAAFLTMSLGPGTNGVGSGRGGGNGPGNGAGDGLGDGGNQGGGLNRGGGAVVMPSVLRDVKPRYTTEAMRARIQGAVLVRAIVRPDGTVGDVRVVRSLDPVFGLDQEAVRAATQWLFRPARMGGQPVATAVTIELVFSLR